MFSSVGNFFIWLCIPVFLLMLLSTKGWSANVVKVIGKKALVKGYSGEFSEGSTVQIYDGESKVGRARVYRVKGSKYLIRLERGQMQKGYRVDSNEN